MNLCNISARLESLEVQNSVSINYLLDPALKLRAILKPWEFLLSRKCPRSNESEVKSKAFQELICSIGFLELEFKDDVPLLIKKQSKIEQIEDLMLNLYVKIKSMSGEIGSINWIKDTSQLFNNCAKAITALLLKNSDQEMYRTVLKLLR